MNNELWSNLSNNLNTSDASSLASIANTLITSLPELFSNEPTNLFSLSNSVVMNSWNNPNNIVNHQSDYGTHTWTNTWEATLDWDLFADFDWNLGEIVDPVT